MIVNGLDAEFIAIIDSKQPIPAKDLKFSLARSAESILANDVKIMENWLVFPTDPGSEQKHAKAARLSHALHLLELLPTFRALLLLSEDGSASSRSNGARKRRTCIWQRSYAKSSAELPHFVFKPRLAPDSTRKRTMSKWPWNAAMCNAVFPRWSVRSLSAPASTRMRTISRCPP